MSVAVAEKSRDRYYNPNSGRFISEDPIAFDGKDFNLYRYVENNPLKYSDPSGTILISEVIALGASPFILSSIIQTNSLTNQILRLESSIEQLTSNISSYQSQLSASCDKEKRKLLQRKVDIANSQIYQSKREIFGKRARRRSLLANTLVSSFLSVASSLGFTIIMDF